MTIKCLSLQRIVSSVMGVAFCLLLSACSGKMTKGGSAQLVLNDSSYFEAPGLNVMVFSHSYDAMSDDSQMVGIEIVHHGLRTVTNGDVRLNPIPGQWDLHSTLIERKVERENNLIIAQLKYDTPHFIYQIQVRLGDGGIYVSVWTDQPVPDDLVGVAGLNIEFTSTLYSQYSDDKTIVMKTDELEPSPIVVGKKFDIAPDDAKRHITVSSTEQDLLLYDGRNEDQSACFVLRSLLPAEKSGKILEWFITVGTV
ncbi:hypothetical protein M2459_002404 [Parabacteroides sp. PF5-5]|uniref:hypothetical protein n=1 Tax=unclassified Parabacteroides TaxID=2649774 RepID=UPI002474FF91|nr:MULTISPECIES: hypothetical protein [unclassified Parabacteroides]MDH6305304.1 hypothetical protein [Parabacteroides sp. PH5-39]MDH6316657.1 hypothetical protein [Parabacteroides sp. PF5-13]MDH6320163.1 hypothetical protein [Parabacteroides sp. PH5-13]MDH6323894.1 hypothetical protein [Parabacteroides sp. PH5-8]MDH6327840.1 hypothetical protein [Parabacteroides sp. PH5-41]